MKPMIYPDPIPDAWGETISASMATAGGYRTYFTLISGSTGDNDWCTQWDLHVWATTHNSSSIAQAYKDTGEYFNDATSGSADGLTTWLAASGSSDQSKFYISGSAEAEWDLVKSTKCTDLASNETGSLFWAGSIKHIDYNPK
jgi:hypothetical protein